MRISKLGSLVALSILAGVLAVPARAESADEKKDDPCKTTDGKKTAGCPEPAEKPVAFTNDDLDRLFGNSSSPAVSVDEAVRANEGAQPDYLGAMREGQRKEAAAYEGVARARARLAEAEQRVKDLEARVIQIANPLMPRPQLTPEEQKAWANMDNVERMKQNQAEIEQAKRDVEQARMDLQRAQSGGE
jgi:hypothetical protein